MSWASLQRFWSPALTNPMLEVWLHLPLWSPGSPCFPSRNSFINSPGKSSLVTPGLGTVPAFWCVKQLVEMLGSWTLVPVREMLNGARHPGCNFVLFTRTKKVSFFEQGKTWPESLSPQGRHSPPPASDCFQRDAPKPFSLLSSIGIFQCWICGGSASWRKYLPSLLLAGSSCSMPQYCVLHPDHLAGGDVHCLLGGCCYFCNVFPCREANELNQGSETCQLQGVHSQKTLVQTVCFFLKVKTAFLMQCFAVVDGP